MQILINGPTPHDDYTWVKFNGKDLLDHLFSITPLSLSEIFSRISKLSNDALIKSCPNNFEKNLK